MTIAIESRAEVPSLEDAWAAIQHHTHVGPIRDEEGYERARALADELADEVGDDEDHPLYVLFDIAQNYIRDWEYDHWKIEKSTPVEILRYLLSENGLLQKDLSDIASPSLMSDILSGRRNISVQVAKNLGTRFHLDPGIFL